MVTDAFEHSIERDANTAIEQAEARLYTLAETGQIKGGFRFAEGVGPHGHQNR
jgi:hypothetical protein